MVWWSGGLVVWWSGGLVVWWSGGLMVWWSGGLVAGGLVVCYVLLRYVRVCGLRFFGSTLCELYAL